MTLPLLGTATDGMTRRPTRITAAIDTTRKAGRANAGALPTIMRTIKVGSTAAVKTTMLKIVNYGRSPAAMNGGSRNNGIIGRLLHHNLLLQVTTGGALIPKSNYLRAAMLHLPKSMRLSSMDVEIEASSLAGTKIGTLIAPTALDIVETWNCIKTEVANPQQKHQ